MPVRRFGCGVLGASESGNYASVARPPSARAIRRAWLTGLIHQIHEARAAPTAPGEFTSRQAGARSAVTRASCQLISARSDA